MGPTALPSGRLVVQRGRVFFGGQSLEGVAGELTLERGFASARFGFEGKPQPLLQAMAWRDDRKLQGTLAVDLQPESADTARLGARLTSDAVRDLRLRASADGTWTSDGLQWAGVLSHLEGTFPGFSVSQVRTSRIQGTDRSASFQLALQGSGAGQAQGAALAVQGTVPFEPTRPMTVHLSGGADLDRMKAVVDAIVQPGQGSLLAELQPAGSATLALTLGGTPRIPTLDGRLSLQDGRLRLRT